MKNYEDSLNEIEEEYKELEKLYMKKTSFSFDEIKEFLNELPRQDKIII